MNQSSQPVTPQQANIPAQPDQPPLSSPPDSEPTPYPSVVPPQKSHTARIILIITGIILVISLVAIIVAGIIIDLVKETSPPAEIKVGNLTAQYPVNLWSEVDSDEVLLLGAEGDRRAIESPIYGYLTFACIDFSQFSSYELSKMSDRVLIETTVSTIGFTNVSPITTVLYGDIVWSVSTGRLESKNSDIGLWAYYDADAKESYLIIYQSPIGLYDTFFEYAVKDVLESITITPTGSSGNSSNENKKPVLSQNGVKGNYSRENFSGHTFIYKTNSDTATFKFNSDSTFTVKYANGSEYKGTYEVYNGLYITVKAGEIAKDTSISYAKQLADDIEKVADRMMDDAQNIVNTYLLWLETDTGVIQPFMIQYDADENSGTAVNIMGRTQGSFEME